MTEKRNGEITKPISCIIIMGLVPKKFCCHRVHAQYIAVDVDTVVVDHPPSTCVS